MAMRARQTWIRGAARFCPHDKLDEIKSFGGVTLAEVCALCGLRMSQWGRCAGCLVDKRLVHFVSATRSAYCTPDCHQQALTKAKAKKAEREAQAAAKTAKAGRA